MLLHNLDQSQGLCNGLRLQLVRMQNRVLEVRIITGPCAEEIAFIPRRHGQFNVGVSRGTNWNKVKVVLRGTWGQNHKYCIQRDIT